LQVLRKRREKAVRKPVHGSGDAEQHR
jgi:hypothetical protein